MADHDEKRDLVAMIRELEAAWNAHDVARMMAFFDEGAAAKLQTGAPTA